MGLSCHLVVGSFVFTIFAAYLGQSRLGHQAHSTGDQASSDLAVGLHKAFGNAPAAKVIAVSGTLAAEHPFAGQIGELIASKGFSLVTSGTTGGNMNKVRETFSKNKKEGQKSFWAPSTKILANFKEENADLDKPADTDELLDPPADDVTPQVTKADMVIALPGGTGVVMEIDQAKKLNKPCFGVLNKDDEMMDDGKGGKTPANKSVKDALDKNGFKYVNDMDWEIDSKALEAFLDGKPAPGSDSSAMGIFPGFAFAIVMLGLFVAN